MLHRLPPGDERTSGTATAKSPVFCLFALLSITWAIFKTLVEGAKLASTEMQG